MELEVLGVRHHGPGSARAVVAALDEFGPDHVLIEGPVEGDAVAGLAADPDMQPPVALLVHTRDDLADSAIYPFAVFSPEWQALRWAQCHGVPVGFMDLPMTNELALRAERRARRRRERDENLLFTLPGEADDRDEVDDPDGSDEPDRTDDTADEDDDAAAGNEAVDPGNPGDPAGPADPAERTARRVRTDPLAALATAAGYGDAEDWWEDMVESRPGGLAPFRAIAEAMAAVRAELPTPPGPGRVEEDRREAAMRRIIRATEKAGAERVAVVCGAWHTAALRPPFPTAASDNRTLRGLPKTRVQATWVPWTSGRLAQSSGYGAGVRSPGWYRHLFTAAATGTAGRSGEAGERAVASWFTRAARLLREAGHESSPALVVDATRLATALAALRNRPQVGLAEVTEAATATLAAGNPVRLATVTEELLVGHDLGSVPAATPRVPLVADFEATTRRLRFKPQAMARALNLDLRQPNDRDRSRLLHRLRLLGIEWGSPEEASTTGTFKEAWSLVWDPVYAVLLIEQSWRGATVAEAATGAALEHVDRADLPALCRLIDTCLVADLPVAVGSVMQRLRDAVAVGPSVDLLLDALAPLARVVRYRDVRGTDAELAGGLVDGLVRRAALGLPSAAAHLDDEAAATFTTSVGAAHHAIGLLDRPGLRAAWTDGLHRTVARSDVTGLVAGRMLRLLVDGEHVGRNEANRRLAAALSVGADPLDGAAFVEGFLAGTGTVLVHDPELFDLIDDWLCRIPANRFTDTLPLIRRTFATFSPGERRNLGVRIRTGDRTRAVTATWPIDGIRAAAVLPTVCRLLGLPGPAEVPAGRPGDRRPGGAEGQVPAREQS